MSRYLRSAPRPNRPRVDFLRDVAPKASWASQRWVAAFLSDGPQRARQLDAYNEALSRLNRIGSG